MENKKRPNRHSSQSKQHVKHGGRFVFFRKKNHEVKEVLRSVA